MTNQTAILITIDCAIGVFNSLLLILYDLNMQRFREQHGIERKQKGFRRVTKILAMIFVNFIPPFNIIHLGDMMASLILAISNPKKQDEKFKKFYEELENKNKD